MFFYIAKILGTLKNIIIYPLTKIINNCIKLSIFPGCLKKARVVPVFKKGDHGEVSNYRPISIVPLFSKIFEGVLKKQMCGYLECHHMFNPGQFGFRCNMSTTTAISQLVSYIQECFEAKMYSRASFFDLTKAFDCVSHELLVRKLSKYNFHDSSIVLVESYLADRLQYVAHNGAVSSPCRVIHGVPQGSVLGPLLFLLYINDIGACTSSTSAKILLFADDTTALERADDLSLLDRRTSDTQAEVRQWFLANKLSINETKTQFLDFSLRHLEGNTAPVKFLGVYLDPKLSWEKHVEYLTGTLSRNIYRIRSLKNIVSEKVLINAYYGHFHSYLAYAVLCWGHSSHSTRVFAIQRRCIRIISGIRYRDCCRACFVALGILTLPSVYILSCLGHVRGNIGNYTRNGEHHDYNTRTRSCLALNYSRTARARDGISHYGLKFFNVLPEAVKALSVQQFMSRIKDYLKRKAFYSYDEYLTNNFSDLGSN